MIKKRILKPIYDQFIRSHLPRKIASFNGVPVRQPRLFDRTDVRPDYEESLVSLVQEEVQPHDNVVLVGGGWGVGSVHAARQAGPGGDVTVFEGGKEQVKRVRETATLSKLANEISVKHAIVGIEKRIYSDSSNAETVPPDGIPSCDVLVLDCEGAESPILDGLSIRPRNIIVETHHMYDSPAEDVRELLHTLGYNIVSERLEQTPYGDLPVLTARESRNR